MINNKQELIDDFCQRLIHFYGYSEDQIGRNDVYSNLGVKADIVVWRSGKEKAIGASPEIYIVVNCEAEHIKIRTDEYIERFREAALNNQTFYVARNLKETKVFYIDKNASPFRIESISDIPKVEETVSERALKKFVDGMRGYTKDSFLKSLNKCHNLIRNIDKLSPEAAFDEISKVLFIKMFYEKDAKECLVYTKDRFLRDEAAYIGKDEYYQNIFNRVKEKYRYDSVFDKDDRIRLRRETFLAILEELGSVGLYDTSDDIKGIVFESFLGKTFRGELGQFFTPRTIVNFMVEVMDIKEGELICDPCCGSGGFLIKAFEYIQNKIDVDIRNKMRMIQQDSTASESEKQMKLNLLLRDFDKNRKKSRYYKLCHSYLYGVDANTRMARTAKMNMIMHGDGHVGVYHGDGLLNIGGVFDGRFDVVLINPPFGAKVDKDLKVSMSDVPTVEKRMSFLTQFGEEYDAKVALPMERDAAYVNNDGSVGRRISDMFSIGNMSTEIVFIERTLNLLKPGGRAALVLPDGVLDNVQFKKVRSFIESQAKILNITSIPYDVFLSSGANIKPSLVFLQKYKEGEGKEDNYSLTITRVENAGISSTGQASDGNQLPVAAKEIAAYIQGRPLSDSQYTKIVNRNDMTDWNVRILFDKKDIKFNLDYPTVLLKDVLSLSKDIIRIEPDIMYKRLTVRLFNRGITLRDEVLGKGIGTKKQTLVKTGQFVISKIDGKSAAFGFVPPTLDGAIVTADFLVYYIDTDKILPDFLELLLNNPKILQSFDNMSSGTTGRRRLSRAIFENTEILCPDIEEQERLIAPIVKIKKEQAILEELRKSSITDFNKYLFDQQ